MRVKEEEKTSYVNLMTFLCTLPIVILINIISVMIFLKDFDFTDMQMSTVILLLMFWVITALLLTILISYNAAIHYERPMKRLAKATKEVANGDFSVYVDPIHTSDRQDYLDTMICDFNKMVEELGSVETLKTDFFSNVSHEIKTPLAIIQNYAELLQNAKLPRAQQEEYIHAIYDTTKRLSSLITNILKLNKLEKQQILLSDCPYDICQQLCDCILNLENLWDKKHIEIEVNIEDKRMLRLDASLMELVWNNLLSNAIKFTPDHGHIHVQEYVEDEQCFVCIQDDGCGMSKDTIQHIFEKFYQGDTSHTTQGNGLGLALASRILQLSNATIQVVSELENGTTFMIGFPLSNRLDVIE